jgi:hypothetical protein
VSATQARNSLRSNRWTVPVALAATVLLCLAIVVQVQRPPADTVTAYRMERQTATQAFEPVSPRPQTDIAEDLAPDVDVLSDSPERFAKASAPGRSRALIASANEARRAPQERAGELAAPASSDTSARSRGESVAAAPPPSPVLADAARARVDAAAEADRNATDSLAADGGRSSTDSVAAAEAENGKAPAAASSAERDPKAWLQRIAKLRAAGRHAQADREFKAFVKRYPDYVTDEAAR